MRECDLVPYFSSEIFENGGEVDRGPGPDPLSVPAGFEEPGDPTDRELQTGFLRPGH